MAKINLISLPRICLLLIVICLFFDRMIGKTIAVNMRQEHHRIGNNNNAALSNRDIWPEWFQRRQDASMRINDLSAIDEYNVHNRAKNDNAGSSRMRVNDPRFFHDVASRKSRNRNDDDSAMTTTRKSEEFFTDRRRDPSSRDKSIYDMSDANLLESKLVRTTTNARRNGSLDDRKSEKLTAIAVAEFTGTRAVAYAGFHHHNRDYNSARTRDIHDTGYEIVAKTTTPSYTKHHAGRRVCSRQSPLSIAHHHRSRQYGLVLTGLSPSTFLCCPGWSQVSQTSYGCNRPTCVHPCLNGGVCGPHGKCNCPKAFTGTQCQTDVDECVTEKPCGQLCTNLPGSYECHCRYGFHLQPDGQSCRKNGSDGTAFEARDLENDYDYTTSTTTTETTSRRTTPASHDTENEVGEGHLGQHYEIILKRLAKLEKQIARAKKRDTETTEIGTRITQAVESVAAMRRAVDNVQLMQQEIYDMRGKVKQFELESRKLQHLTNRVADLETRLRLRCRNPING